jgi:hypothetical protein
VPVARVAVVDSRVPAARARAMQNGLLKMNHDSGGADSLGPLRLRGFVPLKLPSRTAP